MAGHLTHKTTSAIYQQTFSSRISEERKLRGTNYYNPGAPGKMAVTMEAGWLVGVEVHFQHNYGTTEVGR